MITLMLQFKNGFYRQGHQPTFNPLSILAEFLADEVAACGNAAFFIRCLKDDKLRVTGGNSIDIHKHDGNAIISQHYFPDDPTLELSIEHLIDIIEQWDVLVADLIPYVLLVYENNHVTIKGIGSPLLESGPVFTLEQRTKHLHKVNITEVFLLRVFGMEITEDLEQNDILTLRGLHYASSAEKFEKVHVVEVVKKETLPHGVTAAEYLFENNIVFKNIFPANVSKEEIIDDIVAIFGSIFPLDEAVKINGYSFIHWTSRDRKISIHILVDDKSNLVVAYPI